MNYMFEDVDQSEEQRHWTTWSVSAPAKRHPLKNYISAGIYLLSSFVVMLNGSAFAHWHWL